MKRPALFAVFALTCLPAWAEDRTGPPPGFYTGLYRMLGTAAEGPVDRMFRLDVAEGGLVASICGMADAGGLSFPRAGEELPYLTGRIGAEPVICEAFSNYDNYPVLLCYGEAGLRVTLWPEGDFGAPLVCAD